ncbi:unnamed protein product, partial [Nesidiocoris tenuis]
MNLQASQLLNQIHGNACILPDCRRRGCGGLPFQQGSHAEGVQAPVPSGQVRQVPAGRFI